MSRSTAVVLACLPLFALTPPPSEIAFTATEGRKLSTSVEQEMKMNLVESEQTFIVNGEEHGGGPIEGLEVEITESERVLFVDEFTKVEGGEPRVVARRYEELESARGQHATTPDGEDMNDDKERTSDLEGATVVFTYDEDGDEWTKAFAEEFADRDEELLARLEAEASFADLLPDGDVNAGFTWEIEPRKFLEATEPGGDIPWDDDEEDEGDSEDEMMEALSGSVKAEVVGFAEEDGRKLVTLRYVAELESEFDDSPELDAEDHEGLDLTVTQTLKFAIALSGELVWDLDGGHARTLDLEGKIRLQVDGEQEGNGEGMSFTVSSRQVFEGELEIRARVE